MLLSFGAMILVGVNTSKSLNIRWFYGLYDKPPPSRGY